MFHSVILAHEGLYKTESRRAVESFGLSLDLLDDVAQFARQEAVRLATRWNTQRGQFSTFFVFCFRKSVRRKYGPKPTAPRRCDADVSLVIAPEADGFEDLLDGVDPLGRDVLRGCYVGCETLRQTAERLRLPLKRVRKAKADGLEAIRAGLFSAPPDARPPLPRESFLSLAQIIGRRLPSGNRSPAEVGLEEAAPE